MTAARRPESTDNPSGGQSPGAIPTGSGEPAPRAITGTPSDVVLDQLITGLHLAQAAALVLVVPLLAAVASIAALELAGASPSLTFFLTGLVVPGAAFAGLILHLQGARPADTRERRELLRQRAAAFIERGAGPVVDRTTIGGKLSAAVLEMGLSDHARAFRVAVAVAAVAGSAAIALLVGALLLGGRLGGLMQPPEASPWSRLGAAVLIALVVLAGLRLAAVVLLAIAFRHETDQPAARN